MKKFILFVALVVFALPINTIKANELQETYNPQPQISQEEWDKAQEQEWSNQLVAFAENNKGKRGGWCLIFVRNFTGISRSQGQGMAKNLDTNSQTPKIGAIVKTNESGYGHVGIVIAQTSTHIQVLESNYRWDKRISTRWIPKNSKKIKGYLIYT